MTEWIKRNKDARGLDVIHIANLGLAKSKFIRRYDLLDIGIKFYDKKVPQQKIDNFKTKSQGRYMRTVTDALLSFKLCVDIGKEKEIKKIIINDIENIDLIQKFTRFNQFSDKKSLFVPTKKSITFAKHKIATEEWRKCFLSYLLEFGYFVRYLDTIDLLRDLSRSNKAKVVECRNLIGPYEDIVSGGGPEFCQQPFLTWASFSGAITFNTGNLAEYDIPKMLEYLDSHRGPYLGSKDPRIFGSFFKRGGLGSSSGIDATVNFYSKKVFIPSFIRFKNVTEWRANPICSFYTALIIVRVIYLLDNKSLSLNEIEKDSIVSKLISAIKTDISLVQILLSIEVMGLQYSVNDKNSFTRYILEILYQKKSFIKRINTSPKSEISPLFAFVDKFINESDIENTKIKSNRTFYKRDFEKSLPKGKLIESVTNV